ncbi:MAG: hypothetical protein BA870_05500 [Desulfuromonadales bacterium C00003094]|jgi:uncharacterized protein involved in exopolysaccharide biosynthesis|nr:MAG: hypothetical protein BA870_05500 [Desulfuromonadales bacterium C00003094]OEU75113.1 MAG: hypothetical protein BA869_01935 [Desulfuromonadales bacterium C00003107]
MNHDKTQNCNPSDYVPEEDEINLLDLLLVLAKHKKMIIGTCLVTFVLTIGVTLLLPNIYSATAQILPPENESPFYVSMLKSRTIADAIIEKFDLSEVYRKKSQNQTYMSLDGHVSFSVGKKDGILQIEVEDKDPKRVAEMANAYVEELSKLSDKDHLNAVAALRQFLEVRLEVVKEGLAQTEQKLQAFQEKNKTIRIDDQTKATIEAIARLKGELASKEIELGVAMPAQEQQTAQDAVLREGFEQLKAQISALEQPPVGGKIPGDVTLVTSIGPGLGLQYAGLLRSFRMQVTLFELLSRQYEVARIEEVKNPQRIQVLQTAYPPATKSRPKRSLIVLLATFCSGFLAIFAAFFREYITSMSNEDRETWQQIKAYLRFSR